MKHYEGYIYILGTLDYSINLRRGLQMMMKTSTMIYKFRKEGKTNYCYHLKRLTIGVRWRLQPLSDYQKVQSSPSFYHWLPPIPVQLKCTALFAENSNLSLFKPRVNRLLGTKESWNIVHLIFALHCVWLWPRVVPLEKTCTVRWDVYLSTKLWRSKSESFVIFTGPMGDRKNSGSVVSVAPEK